MISFLGIRTYTYRRVECSISSRRGLLASGSDAWPITSALELVDQSGFESLSLRSVADRAGFTPMAVYRHVEGIEDLQRQVVRRIFEDWESTVYPILEEGEAIQRLWQYADLYLEYALDYPNRYEVLFLLRHGIGTHSFPEGFLEAPASTFQLLIDTVREAMQDGDLSEDDPVEFALFMWSTALGLITLERSGRFPDQAHFRAFYTRSLGRLLGPQRMEEQVDRASTVGTEESSRGSQSQ